MTTKEVKAAPAKNLRVVPPKKKPKPQDVRDIAPPVTWPFPSSSRGYHKEVAHLKSLPALGKTPPVVTGKNLSFRKGRNMNAINGIPGHIIASDGITVQKAAYIVNVDTGGTVDVKTTSSGGTLGDDTNLAYCALGGTPPVGVKFFQALI